MKEEDKQFLALVRRKLAAITGSRPLDGYLEPLLQLAEKLAQDLTLVAADRESLSRELVDLHRVAKKRKAVLLKACKERNGLRADLAIEQAGRELAEVTLQRAVQITTCRPDTAPPELERAHLAHENAARRAADMKGERDNALEERKAATERALHAEQLAERYDGELKAARQEIASLKGLLHARPVVGEFCSSPPTLAGLIAAADLLKEQYMQAGDIDMAARVRDAGDVLKGKANAGYLLPAGWRHVTREIPTPSQPKQEEKTAETPRRRGKREPATANVALQGVLQGLRKAGMLEPEQEEEELAAEETSRQVVAQLQQTNQAVQEEFAAIIDSQKEAAAALHAEQAGLAAVPILGGYCLETGQAVAMNNRQAVPLTSARSTGKSEADAAGKPLEKPPAEKTVTETYRPEVGDRVKHIRPRELCCGSGAYSHAYVVQAEPLVLVSAEGDMLWQKIDPAVLVFDGKAGLPELYPPLGRLAWERQSRPVTQPSLEKMILETTPGGPGEKLIAKMAARPHVEPPRRRGMALTLSAADAALVEEFYGKRRAKAAAAAEKKPPALARQVGGSHYKGFVIEPLEFCQRNKLRYCESNVVKYVCRHQLKGGRADLEKAIHNLELILEQDYPEEAKTGPN